MPDHCNDRNPDNRAMICTLPAGHAGEHRFGDGGTWGQSAEIVHFLPYGSYVASCGRIEDRRYPEGWSDLRRDTTCAECQAQMTDHGDLPPAVRPSPGQPTPAEWSNP